MKNPDNRRQRKRREKMEDETVKEQALQMLGSFQVLPRLIVFDLDYTLWPFYWYVSHHFRSIVLHFRWNLGDALSKREMPSLYPQAKGILLALKDKGIDIAIASRSHTPDVANDFLDKLQVQPMFVAKEIFSSWTHKTDHFQRIHRTTRIPYTSMLFFDDEDRNIQSVSKMGVTSILVDDGVNLGALSLGLTKFKQNTESS
ncbi:hypothetical protein V2J09_020646 [Rumex salicifolius]